MEIDHAIKNLKASGLDVKIKNFDTLIVLKGTELIGPIKALRFCHQIREVNGIWCVYDGGQLPKYESSSLSNVVYKTIDFIKAAEGWRCITIVSCRSQTSALFRARPSAILRNKRARPLASECQ